MVCVAVLTRTLLLMHCARGSHWKTSLNSWNIWAVYLALTSPSKPYIWFMLSVSWLPDGTDFPSTRQHQNAGTLHWSHTPRLTHKTGLTPKQVEGVRQQQLEAKQSENDLNRKWAAVHKVSVEQLSSTVKAHRPLAFRDASNNKSRNINALSNGALHEHLLQRLHYYEKTLPALQNEPL